MPVTYPGMGGSGYSAITTARSTSPSLTYCSKARVKLVTASRVVGNMAIWARPSPKRRSAAIRSGAGADPSSATPLAARARWKWNTASSWAYAANARSPASME